MDIRIGNGYDVHALAPELPLWLGGVQVESPIGCIAHSDGDVAIHALCDALLGALALGDIGKHFPDTDEKYKGIYSMLLLEEVKGLLKKHSYSVSNIDATIIAQAPKLAPHIPMMKKNIASVLGISPSQVNVKATTEEGLGFTGSGEGISSQAIVCLETIANFSYTVASNEESRCAGCAEVRQRIYPPRAGSPPESAQHP